MHEPVLQFTLRGVHHNQRARMERQLGIELAPGHLTHPRFADEEHPTPPVERSVTSSVWFFSFRRLACHPRFDASDAEHPMGSHPAPSSLSCWIRPRNKLEARETLARHVFLNRAIAFPTTVAGSFMSERRWPQ